MFFFASIIQMLETLEIQNETVSKLVVSFIAINFLFPNIQLLKDLQFRKGYQSISKF